MIRETKIIMLWSVIGLAIIATVAYGAIKLYTPTPRISATSDQQEILVAQKVCERVNKLTKGLSVEGSPVNLAECIKMDKSCEQKWGLHSVWSGTSDAKDVPVCFCDDGYQWASDGSGKCVAKI